MTAPNRPQHRPSALSLFHRLTGSLTATLAVAALTLSGLTTTVVLAPAANATHGHHAGHHHKHKHKHHKRHHRPRYEAPSTYNAVRVTCTTTGDYSWDIAVTWKVTGGRYANFGNPVARLAHPDKVWRGGARYITTHETWIGWPGEDPSIPVTHDFHYQQMVAPLRNAEDSTRWKVKTGMETVTFSC